MFARALPTKPARILLINPTRYLGNMLIAGGLIQQFAQHCAAQGIEFKLVVDAAYAELLDGALPRSCLLLYPRSRIKQETGCAQLTAWWPCLAQSRAFNADIAFNIEEDSVSHRLTQFSGARFRLGCSPLQHRFGYQKVVAVDFQQKSSGQQHRWHGFAQVFAEFGLLPAPPGYLRLPPRALGESTLTKLQAAGVDLAHQQVVLHVGATKAYKQWPLQYFADLCDQLRRPSRQIVFIGAGADATTVANVLQLVAQPQEGIINLCNHLSLVELASYLRHVQAIVGNDSGPFHLAAAQGVKGLVLFGPTDVALWGPLASNAAVLKGTESCAPACTRKQCMYQHRCLRSLTPTLVLERLQPLLG